MEATYQLTEQSITQLKAGTSLPFMKLMGSLRFSQDSMDLIPSQMMPLHILTHISFKICHNSLDTSYMKFAQFLLHSFRAQTRRAS
jgi:hypothetical protein